MVSLSLTMPCDGLKIPTNRKNRYLIQDQDSNLREHMPECQDIFLTANNGIRRKYDRTQSMNVTMCFILTSTLKMQTLIIYVYYVKYLVKIYLVPYLYHL